jgi:hypothetical protein
MSKDVVIIFGLSSFSSSLLNDCQDTFFLKRNEKKQCKLEEQYFDIRKERESIEDNTINSMFK